MWKGIVGKPFTPDQFEEYVKTIKFTNWKPDFIVLHNTASPTIANWHTATGAQRMKGLESYYKSMNWSRGPHLFIADDFIWVFTPLNLTGVHSPSWNNISWGIEMVGDYSTESFSTGRGVKVRDNAVSALAILFMKLNKTPNNTTFKLHKEDPATTHNCPGKNVVKADMIQRIISEIKEREDDMERTVFQIDNVNYEGVFDPIQQTNLIPLAAVKEKNLVGAHIEWHPELKPKKAIITTKKK